jgi:hypothetical protein
MKQDEALKKICKKRNVLIRSVESISKRDFLENSVLLVSLKLS